MKVSLIAADDVDWAKLDQFEDRLVFQTRGWLNFIAESQGAIPVIASLSESTKSESTKSESTKSESTKVVGYFTGLVFSRMGIRILGSPFPGWTTPYMGFNLTPHLRREEALRAIETFAFRELKCLHVEISDRLLSQEEGEGLGFSSEFRHTFLTDLSQSEERILLRMKRQCRSCIHKAENNGVRIEEARDEDFADDYYEQLRLVFQRQGLVPTYGIYRVKQMIRQMLPSGNLLLLRARDPKGLCIATGIYVGFNKVALYWGNASFRHSQHYRPNELLNWYALRYWKQRGLQVFDWGGADGYGRYKTKYGGEETSYCAFRKPRFAFVDTLRTGARNVLDLERRLMGKFAAAGQAKRHLLGGAASRG